MDARLPVADVHAIPAGGSLLLRDDDLGGPGFDGLFPQSGATPDDLEAALEARLRNDGPVPVLTRGGRASLALLAGQRAVGIAAPEAITLRWSADGEAHAAEAGRAAASIGARARVVDAAPADPAGAAARYGDVFDLPSVDGFGEALTDLALAAADVPRVLSSVGGDVLLGDHDALRLATAARRPWLDRSRMPRLRPGPFDVDAQRALEIRAYRRVPVNAAHAALALLPAATRDAILATGPRPADPYRPAMRAGIPSRGVGHVPAEAIPAEWREAGLPRGSRPADRQRPSSGAGDAFAAASELAVGSYLVDRELRAPRPNVARPWLDPLVLCVAFGLPPSVRLGKSSRDGWLGRRIREVAGWAAPRRAVSERKALDAWLRGPLDPWLRATLARDRVEATGAFHGAAVLEAVEAWRRGGPDGALDARIPFFLAAIVLWLEREGLRGAPP